MQNRYAEQLAKDPSAPFSTELANEYRLSHLQRIRPRARFWFTFSTCVCFVFTIRSLRDFGAASALALLHLLLLMPCCLIILYICWSEHYQKYYLRLVPLLYTAVVAFISCSVAQQLSRGELDAIGELICNIFAVYFFVNFPWRQSLLLSILSSACFVAFCFFDSVSFAIIVRSETHVIVATLGATVVYFDVEKTNRRRFLEESLLKHLATRDGLSGLMNRRAFDQHLARLWAQGLRDRCHVNLLLIDVDHFKRFNDNHGHQAGDAEIRRVASVLEEFSARPLDMAARYGGEEFALLLFGLSPDRTGELAEQLRNRVKTHGERTSDVPHATVSVGVAVAIPSIGRTPAGLIQLADEALYQAKSEGRDRCVLKGIADHAHLHTGVFARKSLNAHKLG